MKRLIIIPLLLLSAFCFSQTVDTLLGAKGKLIKDTALTIDGDYLFTPSRNHISFDSSKINWFLNGSKLYTKSQQVGIGDIKPRAKLMISDSTGAVSNNDSSGILLTNDTTNYSPSLTFNDKGLNGGTWVKSGWRVFSQSTGGASPLHFQYNTRGGAHSDGMTLSGGNATFAGTVAASGTSTFATGITTATINATSIGLGNFNGGFGLNQTSSYGGGNGGGINIAEPINIVNGLTYAWKGIYVNPTLQNYPNLDLVAFENVTGQNRLNSTNGNTGIGVSSVDRTAKLQVGGTSQGVLFPVMTQSQRDSLGRPVTSVTITSAGSGVGTTTNGKVTFSAGAITATGYYTASGGVVTSVVVTEQGAYGAGQTPVTCTTSLGGTVVLTPVLGASAPATGLTVFCSNCTATDSSTGVYQTWNGSTWKNWW